MSASVVPRWPRSVTKWKSTLDAETLRTILTVLGEGRQFDGGALLDDVGAVLGDVAPDEDDVEELADRLRGHLMRLVGIALDASADADAEATELIERAREVRAENTPGDYRRAIGHLRRMAWSVNELLERLSAIGCLKEYS